MTLNFLEKDKKIMFLTHPVPKVHVGDKVLLRNHIRNVWDPKYDIAYCMVSVMGQHLELAVESGKIYMVNV